MTKRRYTEQEDLVIITNVIKYHRNLYEAFDMASLEINRDFCSIKDRYYKTIRFSSKMYKLSSKSGIKLNNTKIIRRKGFHVTKIIGE